MYRLGSRTSIPKHRPGRTEEHRTGDCGVSTLAVHLLDTQERDLIEAIAKTGNEITSLSTNERHGSLCIDNNLGWVEFQNINL